MCSLLCYRFQCSSCNATYYGKTKRYFKVCVSEHMGVSVRTGKNIKSIKNFTERDYIFVITLCLLKIFLFSLMKPMILE